MFDDIRLVLAGFSQVMLQNNLWTGVFFLAGIFYNSWTMGMGALLGVLSGTIAGRLLGYSKKELELGLYGFNGVLVGIAAVFFFGFDYAPVISIIPFAALSSIIAHYFLEYKFPPLTAPFVISTWLLMVLFGSLGIAMVPNPLQSVSSVDVYSAISKGFGQVMFQDNVMTGLLFLIGVLFATRMGLLFGLLGSVAGAMIGMVFSMPVPAITAGIYGYNAVLCGIALQGKHYSDALYAFTAIVLSVVLVFLMGDFHVPALTAPFVLSTWLVISIKNKFGAK